MKRFPTQRRQQRGIRGHKYNIGTDRLSQLEPDPGHIFKPSRISRRPHCIVYPMCYIQTGPGDAQAVREKSERAEYAVWYCRQVKSPRLHPLVALQK